MVDFDPALIGTRVQEQRKKLGYSREKLAEVADISNSFLADIEHGIKNFSVPLLFRLCKALGVSADYLLFGKTEASDLSGICQMLSGLDTKYLPHLEELLGAYIKSINVADSRENCE